MGIRRRESLMLEFREWGFDKRGYAKTTRDNYIQRARHCDVWLTEHRGCSIHTARLKDLEAYQASLPKDPKTRNNSRAGLVAFCDFLKEKRMMAKNLAVLLPRLREPESLPRPLASSDTALILKSARALGPLHYALICVMAYAGLRRAETVSLEWGMWQGGWLSVTGKGAKDRRVPVHPELHRALTTWRHHCQSPEWVFPSSTRQDRPISTSRMAVLVHQVGDQVGVELTPHALRHTFATELLDEGNDVRTIQTALGHSSLLSTQIYTKVRPPKLREAVLTLAYGGDDLDLDAQVPG